MQDGQHNQRSDTITHNRDPAIVDHCHDDPGRTLPPDRGGVFVSPGRTRPSLGSGGMRLPILGPLHPAPPAPPLRRASAYAPTRTDSNPGIPNANPHRSGGTSITTQGLENTVL